MEFLETLSHVMDSEKVILDELQKHDYLLGLSLLGAVADEFFIANNIDVKEGWNNLIEASKFAHKEMGD